MEKDEVKVFTFEMPTRESVSGFTDIFTVKASAYRGDSHDFNLRASLYCSNTSSSDKYDILPSSNWNSRNGVAAWKKG